MELRITAKKTSITSAVLAATLLLLTGSVAAHSDDSLGHHKDKDHQEHYGESPEAEGQAKELDHDHGHHVEHHEEVPELAEHMAVLSILTHKLGLSIDAKNQRMTQFYTVESFVKAKEIQEIIPEYEGKPVGEHMSSMLMPGYYELTRDLRKKPVDFEKLESSYNGLIARCNACHIATGFDYIKVKHNPHNPYMLDFTNREASIVK